MNFTVLEVPLVRPGLRDTAKQKARGTYDDEVAALDAVRRLAETTDPDLLVLAGPGWIEAAWGWIAEGRHLVSWATLADQPRRRGIPRVRSKGNRLLCGQGSCGGDVATIETEGARPVDVLIPGAERHGLPTWVGRGQARRFTTHPGRVGGPLRPRHLRVMERGPLDAGKFVNPAIEDVVLLECPHCISNRDGAKVSLLVTRVDTIVAAQ